MCREFVIAGMPGPVCRFRSGFCVRCRLVSTNPAGSTHEMCGRAHRYQSRDGGTGKRRRNWRCGHDPRLGCIDHLPQLDFLYLLHDPQGPLARAHRSWRQDQSQLWKQSEELYVRDCANPPRGRYVHPLEREQPIRRGRRKDRGCALWAVSRRYSPSSIGERRRADQVFAFFTSGCSTRNRSASTKIVEASLWAILSAAGSAPGTVRDRPW